MPKFFWWLVSIFLLTHTPVECGIFVPEELPSFLSLLYSIVPPLRVGKDSRFGAGFRIGPNADFQFLVELGPQTNTLPLGPGPSPDVDDTLPGVRRHVASSTTNAPSTSAFSRRRPSSSRNWGYNYIQPKRQKVTDQTTNQNKINFSNGKNSSIKNTNNNNNIINQSGTSSATATKGPPIYYQQQQQNNIKNFEVTTNRYMTTTRRVIRLPDSIILPSDSFNVTRPLPPLDNNKNNNEFISLLTSPTKVNNNIIENNDNNKITTKDNTLTTFVTNNDSITNNKSSKLNTNQILEDTLRNSTSKAKKTSDTKRNENRRPRVIRDWFLTWFDNLRKQGNAVGDGTGSTT